MTDLAQMADDGAAARTRNADTASTGTVPGAYPRPALAWRAVIILTLLYSLSLMDRQVITLLVADIRADLHISDFQLGLLHGMAFALFYVSFGLVFGWAVDRYPRRAIIFGGVVFWSFAASAGGIARNWGEFLLARFGVGAGEAALNPAAYSIIADSFPKSRLAVALSVFGSGSYVGGAAAIALGGMLIHALPAEGMTLPLLGHLASWRIVMVATGAPGLLLCLLVWVMADPPRRGRLGARKARLGDAFAFMRSRWRFYLAHFVGYGLLAANAYGFGAWTPTYMVRVFHMPIVTVGFVTASLTVIFGIGGTVFSGWLIDRLFARGQTDIHMRLFIGCAFAQIGLLFAAAWASSFALYYLCIAGAMFLASYTGVAAAALQITTPNEYRGQVSSLYLFVFTLLGIGIGPAFIGALTTFIFHDDMMLGWAIATCAAIILPLAMIVLYSGLRPMREAVAQATN